MPLAHFTLPYNVIHNLSVGLSEVTEMLDRRAPFAADCNFAAGSDTPSCASYQDESGGSVESEYTEPSEQLAFERICARELLGELDQ